MLLNPITANAMRDELEKIASLKASLYGAATGGGLAVGRNALREWDNRNIEKKYEGSVNPEDLKAARRHRLKRMAVSTGGAALVGGAVGHLGSKAFKHGTDYATRRIHEAGNSVVNKLRDEVIDKGVTQALKRDAPDIGSRFGEAAGRKLVDGATDRVKGGIKARLSKLNPRNWRKK